MTRKVLIPTFLAFLAFGAFCFLLGRNWDWCQPPPDAGKLAGRVTPVAPDAGAASSGNPTTKAKESEENKPSKPRPTVMTEEARAAMLGARALGSLLYTGDPSLILSRLEKGVALLPDNSLQPFIGMFCEGAAELAGSADHFDLLRKVDPEVAGFLSGLRMRDGTSGYEMLISMMASTGLGEKETMAEKVKAFRPANGEEAAYHKIWEGTLIKMNLRRIPEECIGVLQSLSLEEQKLYGGFAAASMATKNPKAALEFYLSPEYPGEAAQAVSAKVLGYYLESNPGEASAILRDAPASPSRDSASAYLAEMIALSDEAGSPAWANSIQNAELKASTLRNIDARRQIGMPLDQVPTIPAVKVSK